MEDGERPADRGAMEWQDAPRPHPGQKRHNRRGPPAEVAQSNAVTPPYRGRAGDPVPRQVADEVIAEVTKTRAAANA